MTEEKPITPYNVPIAKSSPAEIAPSPQASISDETASAILKGVEMKKAEVAEIEKRLDEKILLLKGLTDTIKLSGRALSAPPVEVKEETPQEYARRISGR